MANRWGEAQTIDGPARGHSSAPGKGGMCWDGPHMGNGTREIREPAELCESRLLKVRRLFWKLHTAAGPQAHTLHTGTRAHHSLMEKMPNV